MHWLSSLAPQVQPATLKSYLTHVKSMHIEADLDFSACESLLVQRLIRGIKRYHGEKGRKPKQPITLPVLTQLLKFLHPRNDPLHCVVYATCCLAFSGLLRCGEFTTKSSRFNPATHLSKSCIKFMPSPASPAYILLTLPASKTDPFRKGVTLTIAAAPGQPTCPVSAMQQLLQNSSASPDSPLLKLPPVSPSNGIPLFNVFAPPSPKPASTPGSTPATASVEAAPPQLHTLAFLTTRSSFWAAGAATHTNFILKPTTLGFFNYLPFFIGLVLLLHLPGPPVLQRRLSGSSTIPVGVAPLSAVPRARDHNLTCCLPNLYNSFTLPSIERVSIDRLSTEVTQTTP